MGEVISRTAPFRGLKIAALGMGVAVAFLSTGCTPDNAEESKKLSPSSAQSSASASEENPSGSVETAPKLPDGKVLAAVANVQGNRELDLKGGVRKGPLGVIVSCQGKGTVNVTYTPSGLSFPLQCTEGKVSTTYNQIDLKQERPSASVNVQAPSSVRWAMSVGQ
ncbi:hypothetical protein [Streptomyces cinereoruber]|uniref:hypothetical protein n=1 Tax=Streptomyces cinereoruber TaxID=67260 RepID=UPI003C2D28BC